MFILCKSETLLGIFFAAEEAALEAKIEKRFSLASTLQQETLDVSSSLRRCFSDFPVSFYFVSNNFPTAWPSVSALNDFATERRTLDKSI